MRLAIFLNLLFCHMKSTAAPEVKYVLHFPNPHTHYLEVDMVISGIEKKHFSNRKSEEIEVSMPVWTPGSYLVREYARHVEGFEANDENGKPLSAAKSSKNTWRIGTAGNATLKVSYKVYAYDLTVRTSYIDESQAYLNGASVFCFFTPALKNPHQVQVEKPNQWSKIVTALKPMTGKNFTFKASDFDELVDSPILVGNPDLFSFKAAGVNHTVAMVGSGTYQIEKLQKDMTRIVEAATEVIGTHPCSDYTFIIHNLANGGGGLEHSHSTSLLVSRNAYSNEKDYYSFLSLVAHEYFHLWNVKRIRPIELGPFNYHEEVYCRQLWSAEGWTSYYDDFIMFRAGLASEEKFFDVVCNNFNYVANTKGNLVQSLSEAGLDAWIKYYRPTENSPNSATNYYIKGAAASLALDLGIISYSNGKHTMDHLLRFLWNTYYKQKDRGFTESELLDAMVKWGGSGMNDLMQKWVLNAQPLDLQSIFVPIGLRLIDKNAGQNIPSIGATVANQGGKFIVTQTTKDYPAFTQGLYVGDEILTVDKQRITADFNAIILTKKPGEKLELLVSRKTGEIKELSIDVVKDQTVAFRLEKDPNTTPEQLKMRQAWLRKNVEVQ